MSRGVNKVILIGNVGQDPETRYLTSGSAVTNFTLATSEQWKDRDSGEGRSKTEWHRITVFGKLAEIAGQYLRKGSKVYIEGKLQTRSWDKDGTKMYTTEINAKELVMLDSRGEGGDTGGFEAPKASSAAPADDMDSDIPF